ncbi:hypothetical protein [Epibacterium sp. Ofav1-8]|nr:hypothetical protein [Epibacterium sp. Ofav1-8]MCG7622394.1 hypothetical protein [Epibacterium sp. Ofav1-8]
MIPTFRFVWVAGFGLQQLVTPDRRRGACQVDQSCAGEGWSGASGAPDL